jgi:ribonuclease-3
MDGTPLENRIGYRFKQSALLLQALTHRSYGTPHNERLEFLGDSVLNCVVAAELYKRHGVLKEGELSRLRAHLVQQDALHQIAQEIRLGDFLRLGEGELKSGGFNRPSILADALEALFGAVFLDGGFEQSGATIRHLLRNQLDSLDPTQHGKDAKTMLQELLQSRHMGLPQYTVVATQGAAHNQRFEVECLVEELNVRTTGGGNSRRLAEQEAALCALQQIRQ